MAYHKYYIRKNRYTYSILDLVFLFINDIPFKKMIIKKILEMQIKILKNIKRIKTFKISWILS